MLSFGEFSFDGICNSKCCQLCLPDGLLSRLLVDIAYVSSCFVLANIYGILRGHQAGDCMIVFSLRLVSSSIEPIARKLIILHNYLL